MAYYIIKISIYIHGIYGPYETRDAAIATFEEAYKTGIPWDFDQHHDYILQQGFNDPIGTNLSIDNDRIQYERKPDDE